MNRNLHCYSVARWRLSAGPFWNRANQRSWCFVVGVAVGLLLLVGCNDQNRLVGMRARHVLVGTVSDQGLLLDQQASPQEVVYVLLRAIKDDAESGNDSAAREAAFDRQLNVCAPDTIFKRSIRKQLGRDENVRRIVWHWTPTLAYYKDDFPSDWTTAQKRLVVSAKVYQSVGKSDNWTNVSIELADPSHDPNASVVAQFQLVREAGYWRVVQLGFVRNTRHLASEAKTAATTGTQKKNLRGNG